jgi:sugar phosphate isomerase/epimerase
MSANFVARETGYRMTEGWSQGDTATNTYFQPLATFRPRFDQLLATVRALGFDAVDIWTGHLNWTWASPEHLAIAQDLLRQHGLTVTSYAGSYGSTLTEFEAACRVAQGLGTRILGGTLPLWTRDRASALATLRRYDLVLAIENHPGTLTPDEMLAAIGEDVQGTVGTAVDTGWYGTAGIDAVQAIQNLGSQIMHVHLKDVVAPGSHDTCRFGRGCVPVEACVRTLLSAGYRGPISVEHEPSEYDPSDDCAANLALLRTWVTR